MILLIKSRLLFSMLLALLWLGLVPLYGIKEVIAIEFAPIVNYGTGSNPISVFASDLDGDGDADLAVANYVDSSISILKNTGLGGFYQAGKYTNNLYSPNSVFVSDLDGDGDADLAVTCLFYNDVSILKNNGDGTFDEAESVTYYAGFSPTSVFASDLDGDGDADLAVATRSSITILKNNGDGTFAEPVEYYAGFSPISVFASDLDGDGDADLAVATSSSITILKNNGDGTFAEAMNYATYGPGFSVFASDLDGDGDADLAVAGINGYSGYAFGDYVYILANKGDGTFATLIDYLDYPIARYYFGFSEPTSVFASDLDGDGDADLSVTNAGSTEVFILENNGSGFFGTRMNYGGFSGPTSVFASDLDGDGDGDLAVTNYDSNNVSILINCVTVWYKDADNDGYSDGTSQIACNQATGYKQSSELTATSGDCNDSNASINPGATEVCDNVDNDCDGSIDEDLTQQTTCGVGACGNNTGTETCSAGAWGGDTCNPLTGATTEACNNIDDDCDGSTDENLTQQTTCGVGACSGNTGTETCSAGGWGGNTCDPYAGSTTEVCDNVDNDCDGSVDENYQITATTCGVGACGTQGQMTCLNGTEVNTCTPGAPAASEMCDGIDNNCNGQTDEGCLILTLSAVKPGFIPQGAVNQPVTITGSNFVAGATVSFTGAGVTVNSVTFVDSTQLVANLTIASNAAIGSRDVTVTNPDGVTGTGIGLLAITTRQGAINNMIDQVNQFLASGQIDQGTANSLLASLNNAGSALAKGNNNAAKGILGALINKLNAFDKGGQITSAIRDKFVSEINALLSAL